MSDSNNHRDPFTDTPEDHATITNLVQRAVQTHRQPEESTRKRKRYPTEDRRSKMTVDLDPETTAKIREIAKQERVGTSAVAQGLLDYALNAYESGRLRFERRPAYARFGLAVIDIDDNES
jgi:LmbE family N-acetylglucosaminyl deacetylase